MPSGLAASSTTAPERHAGSGAVFSDNVAQGLTANTPVNTSVNSVYKMQFLGRKALEGVSNVRQEVRPYVRPKSEKSLLWTDGRTYVRTSVRPSTKSFSDFNEIWYIDKGQWPMHVGMPYDPIQGQGQDQGQGHECLKSTPLKLSRPSVPRGTDFYDRPA